VVCCCGLPVILVVTRHDTAHPQVGFVQLSATDEFNANVCVIDNGSCL